MAIDPDELNSMGLPKIDTASITPKIKHADTTLIRYDDIGFKDSIEDIRYAFMKKNIYFLGYGFHTEQG